MDNQDHNLLKILKSLTKDELVAFSFGCAFGLRHVMYNVCGVNPGALEIPDLEDDKLSDEIEEVSKKVRDIQHQMLLSSN